MEYREQPSRQQGLLDAYERLLARTRLMLDLARDANWPELLNQEIVYLKQVEQVASRDNAQALDTEQQARQASLLEQILENDLEIRQRLINRRNELGKLISASQRQRNLSHAYGVPAPSPTQPVDPNLSKRAP
ncbi:MULTISPECIES: flagellar protein FliT [Halomonas]|uniref:Flagellar protein FliT n=1 Tax=Halomonas ventosae TaxID=229007 RepID=A0A4R6I428_9GAMM|nr:flagellar protein FliT [Halomonas ventosae]TDO16763.1 flagellar protein FliT [Halomonas ventosae]